SLSQRARPQLHHLRQLLLVHALFHLPQPHLPALRANRPPVQHPPHLHPPHVGLPRRRQSQRQVLLRQRPFPRSLGRQVSRHLRTQSPVPGRPRRWRSPCRLFRRSQVHDPR